MKNVQITTSVQTLVIAWLIIFLNLCSIDVIADDRDLDRQLINSLIDKDIDAARRALDNGANPQAVLGSKKTDSALCSAIDDRGSVYLQLLLDYGAAPDFNTHQGPYKLRTPLACAIDLYNPVAFDLLLAKGADPDADLCSECAPRFRHTVLTLAVGAAKYPMALTLAKNSSEVDVREMRKILFALEQRPYIAIHPWNDERNALIEWVREQGVVINPRPANPALSGATTKCLFSVRDHMEGLSKGTICE